MTIDTTQLLEHLKSLVTPTKSVALATALVLGTIIYVGHEPKPKALSTRQNLQNVSIQGCDYILFTIGEETNSNFAMAITHSGVCTNWAHHGVLLSEEEAKQLK